MALVAYLGRSRGVYLGPGKGGTADTAEIAVVEVTNAGSGRPRTVARLPLPVDLQASPRLVKIRGGIALLLTINDLNELRIERPETDPVAPVKVTAGLIAFMSQDDGKTWSCPLALPAPAGAPKWLDIQEVRGFEQGGVDRILFNSSGALHAVPVSTEGWGAVVPCPGAAPTLVSSFEKRTFDYVSSSATGLVAWIQEKPGQGYVMRTQHIPTDLWSASLHFESGAPVLGSLLKFRGTGFSVQSLRALSVGGKSVLLCANLARDDGGASIGVVVQPEGPHGQQPTR